MLELQNVGFKRGKRWILQELNERFRPGEFWGIIGPNGSGKSTMLRLLSGDLAPSTGKALLDNKSLQNQSPVELARKRAFLTQKSALQFPFTVEEVVQFGQFHSQTSSKASNPPEYALSPKTAMEKVQVDTLSSRLYPTLSGGEACRVDLARVLSQQTPILLLDEPTNHLDPKHQVMILSLCKFLASTGALLIAALHDLNFASQYCSHLLMLQDGKAVARGAPEEVLHPKQLAKVYNVQFDVRYDGKKRPFVMPLFHEEEWSLSRTETNRPPNYGEIQ